MDCNFERLYALASGWNQQVEVFRQRLQAYRAQIADPDTLCAWVDENESIEVVQPILQAYAELCTLQGNLYLRHATIARALRQAGVINTLAPLRDLQVTVPPPWPAPSRQVVMPIHDPMSSENKRMEQMMGVLSDDEQMDGQI